MAFGDFVHLRGVGERPLVTNSDGRPIAKTAEEFRTLIGAASSDDVVTGGWEGYSYPNVNLRVIPLASGNNTLPNGSPGDILMLVSTDHVSCAITPASGDILQVLHKASGNETPLSNGNYLDVARATPILLVNLTGTGGAFWEMQKTW